MDRKSLAFVLVFLMILSGVSNLGIEENYSMSDESNQNELNDEREAYSLTISEEGTFDDLDQEINDLMVRWGIPASQFALTYGGELVHSEFYGQCVSTEPLFDCDTDGVEYATVTYNTPDSSAKFRIASLSKAVTAAGILYLVQNGQLSLDDKMVDLIPHLLPESISGCAYPAHSNGWNHNDTTVKNLLHHSAGFDIDNGGDSTVKKWEEWGSSSDTCIDVETLKWEFGEDGAGAPVNMEVVIREWLRRPLDFEPGTRYDYSNLGYAILGEIIEETSGMDYEIFIKSHVFAPMGMSANWSIGNTLKEDKLDTEVLYFDYNRATSSCLFPTPWEAGSTATFPDAPRPYCGQYNIQDIGPFGGWVTDAAAYARFITYLDGTHETDPDFFISRNASGGISNGPESPYKFMIQPPDYLRNPAPVSYYYGNGVSVYSTINDIDCPGPDDENHVDSCFRLPYEKMSHTGSFSGTATIFKRLIIDNVPVVYVLFANTEMGNSDDWRSDRANTLWGAVGSLNMSEVATLAGFDDSDGDGIIDTVDNCIESPNPDQIDSDFDGVGNACSPSSAYDESKDSSNSTPGFSFLVLFLAVGVAVFSRKDDKKKLQY